MLLLDKVAPVKEIRVKKKSEPWMTTDIFACIKRRNQLFDTFRKNKARTDVYQEYCKLRNKVQRDIKLAKQFHFQNKVEQNKDDSKKPWYCTECRWEIFMIMWPRN